MSTNVLDDCVAALFSEPSAAEVQADVFAAAESEVRVSYPLLVGFTL